MERFRREAGKEMWNGCVMDVYFESNIETGEETYRPVGMSLEEQEDYYNKYVAYYNGIGVKKI